MNGIPKGLCSFGGVQRQRLWWGDFPQCGEMSQSDRGAGAVSLGQSPAVTKRSAREGVPNITLSAFYKQLSQCNEIENVNISVAVYVAHIRCCELSCADDVLLEHYKVCHLYFAVAVYVANDFLAFFTVYCYLSYIAEINIISAERTCGSACWYLIADITSIDILEFLGIVHSVSRLAVNCVYLCPVFAVV